MSNRRIVLAATAGNFLEFYNFTIYAFFGPMIAAAFFPTSNHLTGLFYALLTFGLGFLTRPIGAIAMGSFEAAYGRQAALRLTFLAMGAAGTVLAVTPDYHSIGLAAPLLVALARLLQGFSEGGEVGPATTLLLDMAPAERRAEFVMFQPMTQILAGLAAVIAGSVVSAACSHEVLYAWAWRLPFLAGIAIVPVGLLLRRQITEKASTGDSGIARASTQVKGGSYRAILLSMIFLSCGTIINYTHLFGVSYAITVLHLSPLTGMLAMVSGLMTALISMLVGLRLGRVFSPRTLIIVTSAVCLPLTYPAFFYAITDPGLPSQIALNVLVTGISAVPTAFVMLAVLEAIPEQARSMKFGIIYALTISIFGGSTQPALTWLIRSTGSAYLPCWVVMAASVVGLLAILSLGVGRRRLMPSQSQAATSAKIALL